MIAQVHEQKDKIRDLTTQLKSAQNENTQFRNHNSTSLEKINTQHEVIRKSKWKSDFQISIIRQYTRFQNIGNQKLIFRDKINPAITSHFETKEQKRIFEKVKYLENRVAEHIRQLNELNIESNERKYVI